MKEIRQGIKKSDLEQWDGFRHIFKFTIFDLEEEWVYTPLFDCFSHKLCSFAQTVQFHNLPGCCLSKLAGKSGGENGGKRCLIVRGREDATDCAN